MGSIVVCGGSVIGLSVAMMLAKDGHEVTVLEADPDGPPEAGVRAWSAWERKGVPQFHQPHNLFARFREIADDELPGLTQRLLAAGCVWVDYLAAPPPTLTDREPRPGDDRIRFVSGRRPVIESAVAVAAEEEPGVTVRRGVHVAGLLAGTAAIPGVPHVVGVRTADGEEIRADLVVDAMGRRTPSADWLAGIGSRPPLVESADSGFVYYTRYYSGPELPRKRAAPLSPLGSISVLTLDGDNGTWSVTVFGPTRDSPLKALRSAEVFDRVLQACPAHAHWLDGEPLTGVVAMAGILDRYRRFVVDGEPVVTGFAAVGDSWACTNPSAGRGLSMGMIHAQQVRRVVAEHLPDPAALAWAWDEATERAVTPYYRNQMAADRARMAQMDAVRAGTPPPPPDPAATRFLTAAMHDPVVPGADRDHPLPGAAPGRPRPARDPGTDRGVRLGAAAADPRPRPAAAHRPAHRLTQTPAAGTRGNG